MRAIQRASKIIPYQWPRECAISRPFHRSFSVTAAPSAARRSPTVRSNQRWKDQQQARMKQAADQALTAELSRKWPMKILSAASQEGRLPLAPVQVVNLLEDVGRLEGDQLCSSECYSLLGLR